MKIEGVQYKPSGDQPADGKTLRLTPTAPKDSKGRPPFSNSGESGTPEAKLIDGRTMLVSYNVDTARPALDLLSKTVKADTGNGLPLDVARHERYSAELEDDPGTAVSFPGSLSAIRED